MVAKVCANMTRRISPAPLRSPVLSSSRAVAAEVATGQPSPGAMSARCNGVAMPGVTVVAVAGVLIVAALLVISWLPRGESFDLSS